MLLSSLTVRNKIKGPSEDSRLQRHRKYQQSPFRIRVISFQVKIHLQHKIEYLWNTSK